MKKLKRLLLGIGIIMILAEGALHLTGLGDFPLYDANSEIGYILKPNQSGVYLNKNKWTYNDKSMLGPAFAKKAHVANTLLVGDSIVLGGNPVDFQDRLGPQLAGFSGRTVWSSAAGSWSLLNELAYIRLFPEVLDAVDEVVFVVNSGDFAGASSWACEETHPRSKPVILGIYLFKKFFYNWSGCETTPEKLKFASRDWQEDLKHFLSVANNKKIKVIFVFYPDKNELLNPDKRRSDLDIHIGEVSKIGVQSVIRVADDTRWQPDLYRDSIHPSVRGNEILARIIASPQDAARK